MDMPDLTVEELVVIRSALTGRMVLLNGSAYRHRTAAAVADKQNNYASAKHHNEVAERESTEWKVCKAIHDTLDILITEEYMEREGREYGIDSRRLPPLDGESSANPAA